MWFYYMTNKTMIKKVNRIYNKIKKSSKINRRGKIMCLNRIKTRINKDILNKIKMIQN